MGIKRTEQIRDTEEHWSLNALPFCGVSRHVRHLQVRNVQPGNSAVCDRLSAGIATSNPAEGKMSISCVRCVLCRYRP